MWNIHEYKLAPPLQAHQFFGKTMPENYQIEYTTKTVLWCWLFQRSRTVHTDFKEVHSWLY